MGSKLLAWHGLSCWYGLVLVTCSRVPRQQVPGDNKDIFA